MHIHWFTFSHYIPKRDPLHNHSHSFSHLSSILSSSIQQMDVFRLWALSESPERTPHGQGRWRLHKKPQARGTFLLWGNSANPWLSCLKFYLHLQWQQWNSVTEPDRSISSWLESGCLSITLHYIAIIQLSSKLELNLNWILGCYLNMWVVLKTNKTRHTNVKTKSYQDVWKE